MEGACQLRGWWEQLRRAVGSLRDQTVLANLNGRIKKINGAGMLTFHIWTPFGGSLVTLGTGEDSDG